MTAADFTSRSFLERVSLAGREQVYSAALAWALDDRSPLPLAERLGIIAAISGVDTQGCRGVRTDTERKHIDLVITLDSPRGPMVIVVENKLKATESEGQLARYDAAPSTVGAASKVFLTLGGDAPSSPEWRAVSYAQLLGAMVGQASQDPYWRDLCCSLARLVAIADAAAENRGGLASSAFDDDGGGLGSAELEYVRENRLEVVVQRLWMRGLASRIHPDATWSVTFSETNRQALINVASEVGDRLPRLVGLQLQRRSLKAFCMPWPYPSKASDAQLRAVEVTLEELRRVLNLGAHATPSKSRTRGFRSFTVETMPIPREQQAWAEIIDRRLAQLASLPGRRTPKAAAIPPAVDGP